MSRIPQPKQIVSRRQAKQSRFESNEDDKGQYLHRKPSLGPRETLILTKKSPAKDIIENCDDAFFSSKVKKSNSLKSIERKFRLKNVRHTNRAQNDEVIQKMMKKATRLSEPPTEKNRNVDDNCKLWSLNTKRSPSNDHVDLKGIEMKSYRKRALTEPEIVCRVKELSIISQKNMQPNFDGIENEINTCTSIEVIKSTVSFDSDTTNTSSVESSLDYGDQISNSNPPTPMQDCSQSADDDYWWMDLDSMNCIIS